MSLDILVNQKPNKRVIMVQPRTTHRGEINFELVSILRLGLPILAGALRDQNYDPDRLNNYEVMQYLEDRSGPLDMNLVQYFKPDAILITGLVNEIPRAFELSDMLRQEFPTVPQIGGGPHMSALPGEALHFGSFDVIGQGQGTRYITTLLDVLTADTIDQGKLSEMKFISYMSDDRMVISPTTVLPMGLERAPEPLPDYDTIHELTPENPLPALTIQLSDSCPYRCTFCRVWTHNGDFVQLGEDEQLARWAQASDLVDRNLVYQGTGGRAAVFIVDDLAAWGPADEANLPPGWTMDKYREIRQERLDEYNKLRNHDFMDKFYTIAQVRIAHGDDPEMIEAMVLGARNKMVYAGIEATDDKSLERMNKRQNVADFERQTQKLRNDKIVVVGMGIIGLPHHTPDSMIEQARWYRQNTNYSTVNWITHLWATPDAKYTQLSLFSNMDGDIMPMVDHDGKVIDPSRGEKARVMRPVEMLPYEQLYTGRFATATDPNPDRGYGPRESHEMVQQYLKEIKPVDVLYERAAKRAGLVLKTDIGWTPRSLMQNK